MTPNLRKPHLYRDLGMWVAHTGPILARASSPPEALAALVRKCERLQSPSFAGEVPVYVWRWQ